MTSRMGWALIDGKCGQGDATAGTFEDREDVFCDEVFFYDCDWFNLPL